MPFHIQLIAGELARRKKINTRYSMRAFARFLTLDASALSRILSGKQEVSLSLCMKIVNKLKLPQDQRLLFIASVVEEKKHRASALLSEAIEASSKNPSSPPPFSEELTQAIHPGALLSLSTDIIYVVDRDGRYLYANDAGASLLGLEPYQMIGKGWRELDLDEETMRPLESARATVCRTRQQTQVEAAVKAPGGIRWFEVVITPILNKDGQVQATFSCGREITDRRIAATRLHRLLDLSHVLSRAIVAEDVGDVVTTEAMRAVGAHAAAAMTFSDKSSTLRSLKLVGFSEALRKFYAELPLDAPSALAEAARLGAPLWVSDLELVASKYPMTAPSLLSEGTRASALIPMQVDGRLCGVIGFRFSESRSFDEDERSFCVHVANLCALALERTRLISQRIQRTTAARQS